MPYSTLDNLPAAVRKLPKHAQEIWQAAFNAAFRQYKSNEAKAAATAWAAVKAQYQQDAQGIWRPKESKMADTALYLSDLQAYPVHYEAGPDGTYLVKGLPVIREGVFNQFPFTAAHLDSILSEFSEGKDKLGFEPPLRPFHAQDHQPIDVRRDTLGYQTNLYRKDGGLFCDAVIYDEETIANLQKGRYRYTSGEFAYTADGPGTRLRALAFVDNPAMKGMPWVLVANSEEFAEGREADETSVGLTPPPPAPAPDPQGGEQSMSMTEKVKALFSGKTAASESEVLAVLQDEDPAVVALREEVAAEKARADKAEAEAVQLREAEAQRQAAERQQAVAEQVQALLAERYILPAQQERLTAILSALAGQEMEVRLAEGATEKRDPVAEIAALLREGQQIAEQYFVKLSSSAPSEADLTAKTDRMAAAAGV